jgi:hypothetical protein
MSVVTQPIAGVSAKKEAELEVVYPSVAAGQLGRGIGTVMELAEHVPTVPLRLIAYVLLGAVMSPFAVLAYALSKLAGDCYVLTNQSIQARSILGGHLRKKILLTEIAHIDIQSQAGYHFHRAGDLVLSGNSGEELMRITAIPFPQRLQHGILTARSARLLADESLAHIERRQ